MRLKTASHRKQKPAIALFLVITSLILISLAMRELIISSTAQVDRVRNAYDRLQAIYLARSNLNLARFWILYDALAQDRISASDTPKDFIPIPFPLSSDELSAFSALLMGGGEDSGSGAAAAAPVSEEIQKSCSEFFGSFQGTSLSLVEDLSSRLNLNVFAAAPTQTAPRSTQRNPNSPNPPNPPPAQNPPTPAADAVRQEYFNVLQNLLSPDFEFIDELERRGVDREAVAQQIRDFVDSDNVENSTNASELFPYSEAGLPYGPKNRPFRVMEELKLIPEMNDWLFQYLKPFVNVVPFQRGQRDAKINLNTVGREVFKALLRDSGPGAETLVEQFFEDRVQNNRVYTDRDITQQLQEAGFTDDNLAIGLVSGTSYAFLVTVKAQVGETKVNLEAVVRKPNSGRTTDNRPVILMRIVP